MSKMITLVGLDRFKKRYEKESGWLAPVASVSDIVTTYGGIVGISADLAEHPVVGSVVVVQDTLNAYIYTGVDSANDGWMLDAANSQDIVIDSPSASVPPELVGTDWVAIVQIGYVGDILSNVELVVKPNEMQQFQDTVMSNGSNRPYMAEMDTYSDIEAISLISSEENRVIKTLSFR